MFFGWLYPLPYCRCHFNCRCHYWRQHCHRHRRHCPHRHCFCSRCCHRCSCHCCRRCHHCCGHCHHCLCHHCCQAIQPGGGRRDATTMGWQWWAMYFNVPRAIRMVTQAAPSEMSQTPPGQRTMCLLCTGSQVCRTCCSHAPPWWWMLAAGRRWQMGSLQLGRIVVLNPGGNK